jgi:hypothetical protein
MRIEKPDWKYDIVECEGFRQWWSDVIEPINLMLEDGVEVYSFEPLKKSVRWTPQWGHDESEFHSKGLLINIQPIKQESASDVLREFVKKSKEVSPTGQSWPNDIIDILNRAKAAIERGE